MPEDGGGLEIRMLQGRSEGIGVAKQSTQGIHTAQMGMRDVSEESWHLRNMIGRGQGSQGDAQARDPQGAANAVHAAAAQRG